MLSYQETGQTAYTYTFQGKKLHITEGDANSTHRVAVISDGTQYHHSEIQPLYRFVSALCWKYKMPVYIGGLAIFGQNHGDSVEPKRYNRNSGYGIPIGLFEPNSVDQRRALGLYREAKSTESAFYSFLAYFKIIELRFKQESAVKEWVNSNLESIVESSRQLEDIRNIKSNLNVGKRIVDLRNGVAHAVGGKRPIDPDGYRHMRELNMLRFLLAELAERMMMDNLGFTRN